MDFLTTLYAVWAKYLKFKHKGIQLRARELAPIIKAVRNAKNCQFLVFGLGNDTPLWLDVNSLGKTVFLEDNQEWFSRITDKFPKADARLVQYPHNITQWEELIDQPDRLRFALPDEISKIEWDVILVDAPAGWKIDPSMPGRMSSIYSASCLIKKNGIVIVHDCWRQVERKYTDKYLKPENLIAEISKRSSLRVYCVR